MRLPLVAGNLSNKRDVGLSSLVVALITGLFVIDRAHAAVARVGEPAVSMSAPATLMALVQLGTLDRGDRGPES